MDTGIGSTLVQYQAIAAPVFVPAPADAPQTSDRWKPTYADRVPAKARAVEFPLAVAPLHVPDVTNPVPASSWSPFFPDRALKALVHVSQIPFIGRVNHVPSAEDTKGGQIIATGSVPILQYQSFAGPLFIPVPDGAWTPVYPSKVWPRIRLHVSLQQAWASDKFTAPAAAAVTGNSWEPEYPDRIHPRRGQHPSRQQFFATDRSQAPGAPPAPDSIGSQTFQQRLRQIFPQAVWSQAQPEFGFIVEVPAQSWLPVYQAHPVRRRKPAASSQMVGPLDVENTIQPAPPLSWSPSAPDWIAAKPYRLASLVSTAVMPVYLADVNVPAPALSWQPRFADRVPPPLRLHPGAQISFAFDRFQGPDAVTAPALSSPVYPSIVYGRPRLVAELSETAPVFVPDITEPVEANSWLPVYPDRVVRQVISAAVQMASVNPYVPGITEIPPDLSWLATYVDQIWVKPRLQPGSNQSFAFDRFEEPAPLFVPDLAQPVFPDRIYRPVTFHAGYSVRVLEPNILIVTLPTADIVIVARADVGLVFAIRDPEDVEPR